MTDQAPRVAAYGYFGMGNIGNEGTLAAFLAYMREAHPEVALTCFASGPDAVRREHGIPATQLMTLRAGPGRGGPLTKAAKGVSRLWDVPRTFAMMREVDVLVVPGTGVLESKLLTQPFGLPYWLFLAVLSCRLRGRKVALLSVGAEQAAHPVTRWLYRQTVRLSHYRSYRDQASADAMSAMGVTGRPGEVFPDLAFSLPVPEGPPERTGHVVIGVMAYAGSPEDPGRGPAVRRTYVEHMSQAVIRLVDQRRSVTLVLGDVADRGLAREIEATVRASRPHLPSDRLSVSEAETMAAIMDEMAQAEAVVASRFHNVICALMLRKPTVSLGYAEKNARLMAEFGLGEFNQAIDSFDVDLLLDQVTEVQRAQAAVEPLMKETLQRFDDALAEQYARFSTELLTPAVRHRPRQAPRRRGARRHHR